MESTIFKCPICKLDIRGYSNFQSHVNSIEHANNVMKVSNNATDEDKVSTSADIEEPTSTISHILPSAFDSIGSNLSCDPCQKRFSGSEPYKQHLASAGHKKKLESMNSPISQLRCNLCDKEFSGKAPYDQHMESKAHIKKDLERKSSPFFIATQLDDKSTQSFDIDDEDNSKIKRVSSEVPINASVIASQFLLSCDVCDKRFSGPAPYRQHMDSIIHKKKVETQNFMKNKMSSSTNTEVDTDSCKKIDAIYNFNFASNSTETDGVRKLYPNPGISQYKCSPCDKTFNGPAPYEQHMKSALHEKKVLQKKQMSEANEFNVFSTSKTDVIPNSEKFFCKICDKQCSGYIPFTQHIESEAHCRKVQIFNYEKEFNKLSKSEVGSDSMSNDDNCTSEMNDGVYMLQPSSELSFYDVLKEVNHFTPDSLNVTTFRVTEEVMF